MAIENTDNIDIYSDAKDSVVSFAVNTVPDETNGDQVIEATHGDEVLRFSPNYTDEELQKVVADYNSERQA